MNFPFRQRHSPEHSPQSRFQPTLRISETAEDIDGRSRFWPLRCPEVNIGVIMHFMKIFLGGAMGRNRRKTGS